MSDARRFLADLDRKLTAEEEATRPIPEASPPKGHRRLCVGMATFDDFDGVWFTVEAISMYHQDVADDLSFLILDNHPEGPEAADLKALDLKFPFLRYVPFRGYRSTAARDLIFREADADVVCCVDSHVLLVPGALAAVLEYFDRHPTSRDLLQGPLLADDHSKVVATHFNPTWSAGMYGQWAMDPRLADGGTEPFDIPMQGLGLFACRREAWPGINPRFRGFGGEEGYLHEKVRQGGGRVLCHPALGWVHRFTRTSGPPYRPVWEDRVRNYRIGWGEVGWDTAPMEAHFRQLLDATPGADTEVILGQTVRQLSSPFTYFDAIVLLTPEGETGPADEAHACLLRLDIDWRVEPWPVPSTPDHHRTCVAAWRRLVEAAQHRGYDHVLGFEGDLHAVDPEDAGVAAVITALAGSEWDVCRLVPPGASDGPDACPPARAIHRRAFARILSDLPADEAGMDRWLAQYGTFDRYLDAGAADGTFEMAGPR